MTASLLTACSGFPPSGAPVTPQRPTYASDTNTTADGTFEIEAGVALEPGEGTDTPVVGKYGLAPRTEVFLGLSPFLYTSLPGEPNEGGFGDVFVGARHRFLDETEDAPSAAFQLASKLPTASSDDGLGSGEADFFAAAIASKQIDAFFFTGFYQFGLLGDTDSSGMDVQHGLAFDAATPLWPESSLFGELAGIFTPEQDDSVVFALLGVAWQPFDNLVFDVAFSTGLSGDAPDYQIYFGTTINLGPVAKKFAVPAPAPAP